MLHSKLGQGGVGLSVTSWAGLFNTLTLSLHLCSLGHCYEEVLGCWLRCSGQSHLLQTQHGHASRRCQEDVWRSAGKSERILPEVTFEDQAVVWQSHLFRCGNRQIKYHYVQLTDICSKALGRKRRLKKAKQAGRFFRSSDPSIKKKRLKILHVFLCVFFVLWIPEVFYKGRKNSLILVVIHLGFFFFILPQ